MGHELLAAMDSEPVEMPLDYLQGHKDGLEWAAQLAEANHPETGDWLYDDPIELAKAIRKGPDMPPAQLAPVVPDESYQQLSDLYHAQEKRLFKIAQRIKGPAFDKYSHSPSQAIDVLEETMHVLAKYYRWLAVHSEPHPKPEVYATDWDSCRKRDDEYQKLKAAGIDFSNASMMISGCSSEHSDIPNGGNYPVIPGAKQRIADAVELLKQAAPAMLADNGGPDGPLAGRLKSPVIPEGYVMVPKEPTAQMYDAGDRQMTTKQVWDAMLAAAPQEVK
ncbi:TPA: hypothetical protein ACXPG9_001976 [Klebsiella pneumoniae]|uniref:hypothetical protein n=1 Tax=Klebsiella pneumoniae TaxID=573 RepID=UPI002ACD1A1F|nr:hypothetical protein [Klebsiella pneumoniae]